MEQYFSIKSRYPDALLFFQVGDFYELFFEDAQIAARFLAITLTRRGKTNGEDIPLCGVPMHAALHYITKLVRGGYTVALCDQMSKPQPGTVVERAVTRVYTPGTLTDTVLLDEHRPSYLLVLSVDDATGRLILLATEVLTGHLLGAFFGRDDLKELETELSRFLPDEVVISDERLARFVTQCGYRVRREKEMTDFEAVRNWIDRVFNRELSIQYLSDRLVLTGLALLQSYLDRMQPTALAQYSRIVFIEPTRSVSVDRTTQRSLEILETMRGERKGSLLDVLDATGTAMGSRLLRKWLTRPSAERAVIERRLESITFFYNDMAAREESSRALKRISDLERIVGRIALQRATRVDYKLLAASLRAAADLKKVLGDSEGSAADLNSLSAECRRDIGDHADLIARIEATLSDEEDSIIRVGSCPQLDLLRERELAGREAIVQLGLSEREKTGLSSLKISFTGTSGYFFEVTKAQSVRIPDYFTSLQGLANRERFTTEQLSLYERQITEAIAAREEREKELFELLERDIFASVRLLRKTAQALAIVDVLVSAATVAYENQYVRPLFGPSESEKYSELYIEAARHPVVERFCEPGTFVPNSVDFRKVRSFVITGPNMGGKSTYLRQIALITLMAHCGFYVPARRAQISLVDKIFTRIGSGDAVAEGKSTFYVEMEEAAMICTLATKASLVILDEVGRGTSTDDGEALAQAIVEYLSHTVQAQTLFATHYHTLAHLGETEGIRNLSVVAERRGDALYFLHKVVEGAAQESFGIDVAQLAGVPSSIITRARMLKQAEE